MTASLTSERLVKMKFSLHMFSLSLSHPPSHCTKDLFMSTPKTLSNHFTTKVHVHY